MPAEMAPTSGAIQKSQSWLMAQPPTKMNDPSKG
jgi:hypothetical protein